MKKIRYTIIGSLLCTIVLLSSCEKDFEDINKSPATVYTADPVTFLHNVQLNVSTASSTWVDSYATKLRWMQYCSNIWGYSQTNFTDIGIGGTLYSEYNSMGSYVSHIPYYIEENMPEELDSYSNLIDVSRVLLIYKGIQASDTFGSLVYSEGWGTRSENAETVTPVFQTQEELYTVWNNELKGIVNRLASATDQKNISNYDLAYGGDVNKWIKAANALRLRIALRLLKRAPDVAKTIAADVLGSDKHFESTNDSFILYFDNQWTTKGEWHSVIDMDRASAPFMTYLNKYDDPRKRLFFQPNNLTPENIAQYNSEQTDPAKHIAPTTTQWEGGTVSYDYRATDTNYMARSLEDGTDMRAMNRPQTRLWKGAQDSGSGGGWAPVVTYADFCFMASEFALEGVSSGKSAQEWYEEGVRASLRQWSDIGGHTQINNYEAITETEIEDFLSQTDIAWNPAIAKEQIYNQTWVEHFKNNNEAWALWRRTGFPNQSSSVVTWDPVIVLGQEQNVPRRSKFSYPAEGTPNYENMVDRFDKMSADPEFGNIDNEFGRLWWDKQ
ncbi:SusD/RagB family nutrient-binding outer membrane lipoprotein [uncultured Maribacter sp.]|uniref:SusD/RagB family nutrient-binding outer membrane lipoprotein n=1 Tax=uncultured Maribacter sp. TaxID=431308 RepID=UPI0030EC8916|tara:strand:- start:27815 stop:29479 length:1665 start_codon:yes stop_codon:yes gene_type:complete